jgi:glycosyltransferase involved in cell wall biosynthesis
MISVVIPTHNRADDLKRALRSLYAQTALPSEIIVVDDGSSPAVTEEVFANAPKPVKTILLRNEASQGANRARNMGIDAAASDWIAFLDDDDEFVPEKIEALEQTVNAKGAEIDLIYHPALISVKNKKFTYVSHCKKRDPGIGFFEHLLTGNHVGGTSMVAVKKRSLAKVGCFDINVHFHDDYELWLRMSKENMIFEFLDRPLTRYYYTINGENITNKKYNEANDSVIEKKYSNEIGNLSPKLRQARDMGAFNIKILNAHLNRNYYGAIKLNAAALVKFKKVRYLAALLISFLGTNAIFRIRSKLPKKYL